MRKKCVIFVHPTMSVDFIFLTSRRYGYAVFAIITALESTQINPTSLAQNADYIFTGSTSPEADIDAINNIITTNNLEIVAIINGIDFALYYTDFLQKYILNYPI